MLHVLTGMELEICIQGSAFQVFTGFFSFPFIFRRRNNYLGANNHIKISNGIAKFKGFEQPVPVKDVPVHGRRVGPDDF